MDIIKKVFAVISITWVGEDVAKGNYTLLLGMQIVLVTVENKMNKSQNIKNRTIVWFSFSTLGYLSEETKTLIQQEICTSMFIVALKSR